MPPAEPIEETLVRPTTKPADETRRKRQPRYAVVLHNDPYNTMPFVVAVLQRVFGYDSQRAAELMMRAHVGGKARVWTGTRELAELKAEQVTGYGADPVASKSAPLTVSVEPIEGDS